MTEWHIITGEYPPQQGGVSDYTQSIAQGLAAAGDRVTVWAPPAASASINPQSEIRDLKVERLPDRFGRRALQQLSRGLDAGPGPRRLLVQYVPQAFGWRGANVPFCWWLRSRSRDQIWVMFHEVAFPFGRDESLARNGLAAVNRVMASLAAGAADRAFVSIPGWRADVQRLVGAGTPVEWLPVPSTIPVVADPDASLALRRRYAGDAPLVGHFGTYGPSIRALLDPAVRAVIDSTDAHVLLLGRQSGDVARELAAADPRLAGRLTGVGTQLRDEVSRHLAACDVMLQPYPDGVSSRRTSAMAALSHGLPVVTTSGWLTESLWEESESVALVPVDERSRLAAAVATLLDSPSCRAALGARAKATYDARFDVRHTIEALQSPVHAHPAGR